MIRLARRARPKFDIRLWAAMVLLAFSVATPGSALARYTAAGNLAGLVLSVSDIQHAYGTGFHLLIARETKNSQLRGAATSLSQGTLTGLAGRITGYVSMYTRQRPPKPGKKIVAASGVAIVLSGVNQYKSPANAHTSLLTSLSTKTKLPKGMSETTAPVHGVGDMAVLLTVHEVVTGAPVTDSVYIGFQQGSFTGLVDVAAYGGSPRSSTVLGLAQVLAARIRAHG